MPLVQPVEHHLVAPLGQLPIRTSSGDVTIQVPRDRNGAFQSPLLEPYQTSTNEREDKIIALYAKGMSVPLGCAESVAVGTTSRCNLSLPDGFV